MTTNEYTLEDIKSHNTTNSLWLCIHGKIYDVTKFQENHPGGVDTLLEHAGTDATSEFEEIFHTEKARNQVTKYHIGNLKGYEGSPNAIHESASAYGNGGSNSLLIGIPILIALFAFVYNFLLE